MTKEEFGVIIAALRSYWPKGEYCLDKESKNTWYRSLGDIDYEACDKAVLELSQVAVFPPTIAEIRSTVTRQKAPRSMLMTEAEAWALVEKAVRRSTYYAAEEFSKLPATVQRAVGSSDVLRSWAMSENPADLGVHEATFKRSYGAVANSEMKERQLSASLYAAIEDAREPEMLAASKPDLLAASEEVKAENMSEVTRARLDELTAKLWERMKV